MVSCIVAFIIPFELFLFSYAVLGPLHYLTEIGWLHRKNYYTKGKYDFLLLTLACIALVYWNFVPSEHHNITADVIMLSVLCSIIFVFIKDWLYRMVLIVLSLFVVAVLNDLPDYFTWIAMFLPTVIHVFFFTWMFMLYGVLKERSLPGLLSILVLFACALLLIFVQPQNLMYNVREYVKESYSTFSYLNFSIVNVFNFDRFSEMDQIYTTNVGFVVMRFIAFAYTYHYLNWFSKTSVIKWHEVSRQSLILTLGIWLASIAIYAYNYTLGMNVLFFLSFLHVFLEFPLNIVSFTGIGRELAAFRKKT